MVVVAATVGLGDHAQLAKCVVNVVGGSRAVGAVGDYGLRRFINCPRSRHAKQCPIANLAPLRAGATEVIKFLPQLTPGFLGS